MGLRIRMIRQAAFVMLAMAAHACTPKDAPVRVKVEARTNQGEPVGGAVVSLDGKPMGTTDLAGRLLVESSLPVGKRIRLEVQKDSDTYYFAPFYETFTVAEASFDGGEAQDLAFKAVLYFVPKPKPGDEQAAAVQQSEKATEPPTEDGTVQAPESTATDGGNIAVQPDLPETSDGPAPGPIVEDDLVPVDATPAQAVAEGGAPEVIDEPQTEQAGPQTSDATATSSAEQELPPPPESPVVLSPVMPLDPESGQQASVSQPTEASAAAEKAVLTVHVVAGTSPVVEADVKFGDESASRLSEGCVTNERGRCVIRFADRPTGNITLVVSKKGFKTATLSTPVAKSEGMIKVVMEHGHTIDLYAVTKSYNYTVGLKDAEVMIDGRRVGLTDRFGRYSHVFEGKADSLVAVGVKPKGFLPEAYETDFVAAGPMKLVKYFAPAEPPSVRLTVIATRPAGAIGSPEGAWATSGKLDEAIRSAARRHVFASSAFKEYPVALYERTAKKSGRSPGELLRAGWQDTELKSVVDALLVPVAIVGPKPAIELSAVDSQGRVLAAAREEMEDPADAASIDRVVAVLAKKIARAFPFEGAVIGKEGDKVTINLGYSHGRSVKAGDVLDVYGVQLEKHGMSQLHRRIATLTVREVFDAQSRASVRKVAPRATIERGDMVVLRPRKAPEQGAAEIRVSEAHGGKTQPVAQANVYFNDQWIGATDEGGRLYLDASGSGTLRIVKQGFAEYVKPAVVASGSRLSCEVKREAAFLRIESKPSGASVQIDGKPAGKTPLTTGIAVPSGFVKLEIQPAAGFKPYSAVLELDQGTLDLTGPRAVALEPDLVGQARKHLQQGKPDEALAVLDGIPKEHSDYLLGRHEAGEIYLTVKDEPAKAAEAFGIVTADEAVREFSDKRFIGSHINEGVALYLTAERLAAKDPETAGAHYQKAIEVLDGIVPYLRFVSSDQYPQAVHNVDYHRALAKHRLWQVSQDPRVLADAVKTWRTYIDGSARSVPAEGASKAFVENAQVYFKQASASLSGARGVSRQ